MMKERKAAIKAEINSIRANVKAGKTSAKQATEGLQKKVLANRAEVSKLKEEMKKLPK